MTLTKSHLVDAIQGGIPMTKKKASDVVETLLELMKGSLASGDDVLISGFGKFCVNKKSERKGRNPATGDPMMLKSRRIVTFKCSGVLRNKINDED